MAVTRFIKAQTFVIREKVVCRQVTAMVWRNICLKRAVLLSRRRVIFALLTIPCMCVFTLAVVSSRSVCFSPNPPASCFPDQVVEYEPYDFEMHSALLSPNRNVHVRTREADDLASKVRVLCFVTTMQANIDKAVAVNVTWAKRCTRHIFVTTTPLPVFRPDEVLMLRDVEEGRDHLTAKTFASLYHLYRHELDNYDWFVKADDDVYIIMENLRLLLYQYSPNDAVYLGHHFRLYMRNGYMSGGASYALSRGALKVMGDKGLPQNGGICRPEEPDEDIEVGKCLDLVGVKPHRTVDKYGRETFHPWDLPFTLFSDQQKKYSLHKKQAGPDCCSQLSITFHYIKPRTMYTIELMLYHINVYGRHPDDATLRSELFKPEPEIVPHKDENEIYV